MRYSRTVIQEPHDRAPRRPSGRPRVGSVAPVTCGGAAPASRSNTTTVSRTRFGASPGGSPVDVLTIANARGMEVRTMPYGAILVSIRVPDRRGQRADVVLGFDTFEDYITKQPPYFGAVVGRYGNRIAKGRQSDVGGRTIRARRHGRDYLHADEPRW
jgi:hypothetical protein